MKKYESTSNERKIEISGNNKRLIFPPSGNNLKLPKK